MSFKRFDGSNFIDISSCKRFDGANWVDAQEVKRWNGANWIDVWDFLSMKLYTTGSPTGTRTLSGNGAIIAATGATAQYEKYGFATPKVLAVGDVVEVTYNNVTGSLGASGNTWALEAYVGSSKFINQRTALTSQQTVSFTVTEAATLRMALAFQGTTFSSVNSASAQIVQVTINGKVIPFRLG